MQFKLPSKQFFPKSQADACPDRTFENYPEVFAIVDTSPIFIQKPSRYQVNTTQVRMAV
jgi:hypothetical protein